MRFLLFAFNQYYPGGGFNDFAGAFGTLEEAVAAGRAKGADDFHVYDVLSGTIAHGSLDDPRTSANLKPLIP